MRLPGLRISFCICAIKGYFALMWFHGLNPAFKLLPLAITYTKNHEVDSLKRFSEQHYSYLFVLYLRPFYRLAPAWSRHVIRKSKNFLDVILKLNAINAGLRTLEVTRVSFVLKACLALSALPSHIWRLLILLSSYGEYFLKAV